QADAGQRRPRPRRELSRSVDEIGCRGQPVIEHRLLPAVLIIESRRQPVAALDHLARGFGVERFVVISDRLTTKAEEERTKAEQKESRQSQATVGRHRLRLYAAIMAACPRQWP